MYKRIGFFIPALVASCIAPSLWAAADGQKLLVGTVELEIGMSEPAARALLSGRYTLSPHDNDFMISDKTSKPPDQVVGRVGFSAGKVAWIGREMGPHDPRSSDEWTGRTEFAKEILATLRRLSAEGSRTGLVMVKEGARGPDRDVDYVRFQFGQRAFTFVLTQGLHEFVTMEESVQAP